MNYLQATLLGLVQGLTEFLPVSSSGHLAITQHYLPGFEQPGLLFDILLHLATMGAVMIYFRRDIGLLLSSPWRRDAAGRDYRRLLVLIVVASIPTGLIGLTFKDFFEGLFENIPVVACMLLVTGTLLWFAERLTRAERPLSALNWRDALLTGIVQGLAVIPGISRSGSTIAVLLMRRVDGQSAARFSFLMSLPAIFGATLLSLRDLEAVQAGQLGAYGVGMLVAFVSGLAAIHFLLALLRQKRLIFFALYCWVAGALFLGVSYFN
ncbi:MAG: undecaprenyl-diphosphatase UppP [Desulfuromonas sp.]|nr:MAG: undecaprenyl-diphosphatase UppP [Desulfuromonas sp.]